MLDYTPEGIRLDRLTNRLRALRERAFRRYKANWPFRGQEMTAACEQTGARFQRLCDATAEAQGQWTRQHAQDLAATFTPQAAGREAGE